MRFLKNIDNEFGSIAREARIQKEKNTPYVPPNEEGPSSSSSSASASPAQKRLIQEEHGHLIGENDEETKKKILAHYGMEEDIIAHARILQGGPAPTPEQERELNKSRTT